MTVLQKLAKAGHLAAGCVQHVFALAAAGESVPAIVATEALDALEGVHTKLKAHRDKHVPAETE